MISVDLSGKVALVTGASSGLGAETARRLAEAGAAVVVNYHRNRDGAEAVVRSITGAGNVALAIQADVAEAADVNRMLEQSRRELGPVAIVVNNAGREERTAPPFELEWSDYQKMLDLNVRAVYHTARASHPDMKEIGWGRIVNIGSIALYRPFPGSAAYVTAKGAMLGVTRGLAAELGADGITVNLIEPCWVPVERHEQAAPEALEELKRGTPLCRIGVPADVANVVLFYCSHLSDFVTGTHLPVNGGYGCFV